MVYNNIFPHKESIHMKFYPGPKIVGFIPLLFCWFLLISPLLVRSQPANPPLKILLIRHAEKPLIGENLSCKGVNRSLALPGVLVAKFGIPNFTYVPSIGKGSATKHSRMMQTITPMASKYNLTINSKYSKNDAKGIAADILTKKGTVLVVWVHSLIPSLAEAFGVKNSIAKWDSDDYDSIWIITFPKGIASISKDRESITPSQKCPY